MYSFQFLNVNFYMFIIAVYSLKDWIIVSIHQLLNNPFGSYRRYDSKTNKSVILASINFIYSSKRFDGQLMWWKKQYIFLYY